MCPPLAPSYLLALLAVEGTIAYLEGNKRRAAEDLSTVADEIRARIER